MLVLSDIAKHYDGHVALQPLSIEVASGQTTVLLGPSGCGKTTVLRIILGLVKPDTGEVRLAGERLTPENTLRLRRRMGYVIQEGGLFPHLNAAANVTLLARFLNWQHDRIQQRLDELTRLTRLQAADLRRYPDELSGGQRQRVALMRALMVDPEVLLLDEPLGALDPLIRFDLQQELREIFAALNKTVVLVTHDLSEAAFFGNRLHLMRAGEIVQSGSAEDLATRPANDFVRRFLSAHRPFHDSAAREPGP